MSLKDRLDKMSEFATQSVWQRSGVRTMMGHLIGPDGDGVCYIPYDANFHNECMANADFIVELVNGYRSGKIRVYND